MILLIAIIAILAAGCDAMDDPVFSNNQPTVQTDPVILQLQQQNAALATQVAMFAEASVVKSTAVPTIVPTVAPTQEPTAGPNNSTVPEGVADVRGILDQFKTGDWDVMLLEGATEQMRGWFETIQNLDPENWPEFPNVDNPRVGFRASNGLEYGLDERNFCPQETCDILVAAGEYQLITGDYDLGFVSCTAEEGIGCAIIIVNVGEVTANFEQVIVDNGFSVAGRYWNGDELEQGIWGGLSHASANMLGMVTALNPAGSTNAGSNCSVRAGCDGVLARVVITSGNHVLVVAETTVSR